MQSKAASFVADDKFSDVVRICEERGFLRVSAPVVQAHVLQLKQQHFEADVADISLQWRNLASTDFKALKKTQLVNHLQHAQQLSNKALLSAHLDRALRSGTAAGASVDRYFPRCWSMLDSGPEAFLRAYGIGAAVAALQRMQEEPPAPATPVFTAALTTLERWCAWARSSSSSAQHYTTKNVPASVLAVGSREWRALAAWCEGLAAGAPGDVRSGGAAAAARARAALAAFARDAQAALHGGGMNAWILKPVGLSCGRGIQVIQGLRALAEASAALRHRVVIQKYVERPLLLPGGRKFDLRQWVMVTSVAPLVVWGYSEAYARLASRPYSSDAAHAGDRFMHLCNHAVQCVRPQLPPPPPLYNEIAVAESPCRCEGASNLSSASTQGSEGGEALPPPAQRLGAGGTTAAAGAAGTRDECATMWSAARLRAHTMPSSSTAGSSSGSGSGSDASSSGAGNFDSMHADSTQGSSASTSGGVNNGNVSGYDAWVLPAVREAVVGALLAVRGLLRKRACGFEWLGFDLLLPAEGERVLLLEVNVSPDVSHRQDAPAIVCSTPVTAALVPGATADALRLLIDEGHAQPLRAASAYALPPLPERRICRRLYAPPPNVIVLPAGDPDGSGDVCGSGGGSGGGSSSGSGSGGGGGIQGPSGDGSRSARVSRCGEHSGSGSGGDVAMPCWQLWYNDKGGPDEWPGARSGGMRRASASPAARSVVAAGVDAAFAAALKGTAAAGQQ
ncbi:tubulin-tyrosine ligase family-domain-containing protein [Tribonema minus]|uniref:Tubulin-tyrosine ligase family-domain-containing protein n=1 Tax=Tribonema minus TaxID=303371 RepID=A0A835ZKD6_9STRA|nr:tubulin-tyrosine ligase family-domain-containing protein [Tribonema minus]